MSNPSKGYDMSSNLAKIKDKVSSATSNAVNNLRDQATADLNKQLSSAYSNAFAATANMSASDLLKQKLGSKVGSLAKVAEAGSLVGQAGGLANKLGRSGELATKLEAATGKLGDVSGLLGAAGAGDALNKLGSAAGKITDAAGKLSSIGDKVGGLTGKLGGLKDKVSGLFGGGDKTDEINAAASTGMSIINAKLANSMFVAVPDEEVVTADAYSIGKDKTLNSIVGKLTGFSKDLMSAMGGGKAFGQDMLKSALSSFATTGKIDTGALTDRVLGALGGKSGIMSKFSDNLRTGLSQNLGLPNDIYDKFSSVVGGVVSGQLKGDVKSASGLFDLMGRVTGDTRLAEFFDVGAEAQLLSTVYREAMALGIPGAIDAMHSRAKSSEAAYYALQANVVVASQLGELDTLLMMAGVLGSDRIRADNPSVIAQVMSAYRFPDTVTPATYNTELLRVTTAFATLDPYWGRYYRNGQLIDDLTVFADASADMKTLLSTDDNYAMLVAIAPEYPEVDLLAQIRADYPLLVL